MDPIEPASTVAEDGGLRASLRAIWSSVAPSWGELAEHVDARGAVVAQAMLDSAGLSAGTVCSSSPAALAAWGLPRPQSWDRAVPWCSPTSHRR